LNSHDTWKSNGVSVTRLVHRFEIDLPSKKKRKKGEPESDTEKPKSEAVYEEILHLPPEAGFELIELLESKKQIISRMAEQEKERTQEALRQLWDMVIELSHKAEMNDFDFKARSFQWQSDGDSRMICHYKTAEGRIWLANGTQRALLTNCFRVWDEGTKDYLQAEVALEIPELAQSIEDHKTLRELGIKRKAEYERILLLERLGNINTLISSSILGNEGPQQVIEGIIEIVHEIIGKQTFSGVYLSSDKQNWFAESLADPKNILETVKSAVGEYSLVTHLTRI